MMKTLMPILALLAATGGAWSQWSVSGLQVKPFVDLRGQSAEPSPDTLRLMQSEVDIRFSLNHKGQEFASFALEPAIYTAMDERGRDMHFSNYYAVFNFGVEKPKLKVGQFVIPFGTLAEYDTHPLILQTPYARTIGIRIDQGFGIEQLKNGTDFRMSVTSGDGRGRHDGGYAIVARVARDFPRGNDTLRAGLSALYGANMPVFAAIPDPLPMGEDGQPVAWVDKSRVAVDLDWLRGIDEFRGEFVFGWDDGHAVNGQWLLYSHPFSYKLEFTVQADRWEQPSGTVTGVGAELHYKLDDVSGLRLVAEHRRGEPEGEAVTLNALTLGYYRYFDISF